MLSPSEFNNAVPKFTNGNYANNPVDPQYIEEPTLQDYNRGVEPLETLPAQWWNWLCNQFTSRFNKINTYVKNIFDEITQLLSLLNISPDGTESVITTGQLKNFFKELYPTYVSDKLSLGTTYVPQTRTVNGHALTGNISVTKSDVGLGSVANTGDSANVSNGGTTKFTTGGAYNILTSIAPLFSASTAYSVGTLVTYLNKFYECTTAHSAGAWNSSHFTARTVSYIFTNYILPAFAPTFSTSTAYSVGTFVIYQNKLYKCTTVHSAGAWNASHFALATLNDLATAKADKVAGAINNDIAILDANGNLKDSGISVADLTGVTDLAPLFSTTATYAVGDYVTYNGDLYRCTVAHSAGAWNASNFTQVTVGSELTNKADNSSLAVPSDAVVHYSFDEIPDMPDGTADVRLLDNNTYDIQSTNYQFRINSDAVISNSNGNVQFDITGSNTAASGVYIINSYIVGKIIKIKLKVSSVVGTITVDNENGVHVLSITQPGIYEVAFLHTAITQYPNFYIFCRGEGNFCTITVEQIYIGDGSYNAPVIDNSGNRNNATNNGGIAVKGVSGKGVHFLKGKYVDCGTDFQFPENFSCSIWCKPEDFSNNCQIVRKQNVLTLVIVSGDLKVYLYDSDGNALLNLYSLSNLPINQFTHIVVVKNGSSFKYYKNGVLIKTATLANTTINKNDNILSIGSNLTEVTHIEDDLLIFDRALTQEEVTALYLNKANTPKYYNLNNYKIDNANVAEEGGTGKYIESIKQEGGLIVPVEQTIDTAPVNASTKPITSGSMYNFFGRNTSAKSWLGKVLGHLLGKTWSYCRFEVSNKNFNSITYGNGIWVASESDGAYIWWSDDGEEWIKGGSTTGGNSSVCYGNGIFVASCNGSTIGLWWSEDGKTWNASGSGYGKFIKKVFYGNNMWIACTSNNDGIYWSTDGKTWTKGTGSNTSYSFNYAHYAAGLWVAGSAGEGLWWSSDGKAWTKGTGDHSRANVSSIYYANNLWVVSDNYTAVSSDGKNWTQVTTNVGSTCAYFANGMWIATRATGLMYNLQANSDSWTEISNAPSITFNFVTYANGIWIACGTQLWWSYDGFNWVPAGGISTVHYNYNFKCIKYANGTWVVGSDNGHGLLYSNISNIELTE